MRALLKTALASWAPSINIIIVIRYIFINDFVMTLILCLLDYRFLVVFRFSFHCENVKYNAKV